MPKQAADTVSEQQGKFKDLLSSGVTQLQSNLPSFLRMLNKENLIIQEEPILQEEDPIIQEEPIIQKGSISLASIKSSLISLRSLINSSLPSLACLANPQKKQAAHLSKNLKLLNELQDEIKTSVDSIWHLKQNQPSNAFVPALVPLHGMLSFVSKQLQSVKIGLLSAGVFEHDFNTKATLALTNRLAILKNIINYCYITLPARTSNIDQLIKDPTEKKCKQKKYLFNQIDSLSHLINLIQEILQESDFNKGPGRIKNNRILLENLLSESKAVFEEVFKEYKKFFIVDPTPEEKTELTILEKINAYMAQRALETDENMWSHSATDYNNRLLSWCKILRAIKNKQDIKTGVCPLIEQEIVRFDSVLTTSRYVKLLCHLRTQLLNTPDNSQLAAHLIDEYVEAYDKQIEFAKLFTSKDNARDPGSASNVCLRQYRQKILESKNLKEFLNGEQLLRATHANGNPFNSILKFLNPLTWYRALRGEITPAQSSSSRNKDAHKLSGEPVMVNGKQKAVASSL